jgi:asparagine synthase (glutamine-hydrolysing)
MCRIFGHFSTDASPHEMRLAAAAQRHGGPDAQSLAIGHGWSLGSNRLATIDP